MSLTPLPISRRLVDVEQGVNLGNHYHHFNHHFHPFLVSYVEGRVGGLYKAPKNGTTKKANS